MTEVDKVNEVRRSVNQLYTAVGSFTFCIGFLAIYRISTPDLSVDFLWIGKISYTATLIFGIPVLTIAVLFILYICFYFLCTIKTRPISYCHYFPTPFNLDLDKALEKLRCLFFFFFTVLPTLVSVVLFYRLFEQRLIFQRAQDCNPVSGTLLEKWNLFAFKTHWWDGDLWRWNSEVPGECLSAYPGIQPLLYVLLILACVMLIVGLAIRIIRMHRPNPLNSVM